MKQVRLEDDVAALVADYQEAEGIKSLSAAANRMLLLAAGPDEPELPVVERAAAAAAAVAVVAPRRRSRFPGPSPDGRTRQPPPARTPASPVVGYGTPIAGQVTKVINGSGDCPHPPLLARNGLCGRCGEPLLT